MEIFQLLLQQLLTFNNKYKSNNLKIFYNLLSLLMKGLLVLVLLSYSKIYKRNYKHTNYFKDTQAISLVVHQIPQIVVVTMNKNLLLHSLMYLSTNNLLLLVFQLLRQVLVPAKHLNSNNQVHIYHLLNSKNHKYLTVNTMRQRILFSQSKLMLVQTNLMLVKQLSCLHYIFVEMR